jgi:hypothetical protein
MNQTTTIYVRVSHDGRLSRDPRATSQEVREANFIVVQKDDQFVVQKDRYGSTGRVLTKTEADARAFDHVDVAQGRKSSKTIFLFG